MEGLGAKKKKVKTWKHLVLPVRTEEEEDAVEDVVATGDEGVVVVVAQMSNRPMLQVSKAYWNQLITPWNKGLPCDIISNRVPVPFTKKISVAKKKFFLLLCDLPSHWGTRGYVAEKEICLQ
jgi:hypothetical protein